MARAFETIEISGLEKRLGPKYPFSDGTPGHQANVGAPQP